MPDFVSHDEARAALAPLADPPRPRSSTSALVRLEDEHPLRAPAQRPASASERGARALARAPVERPSALAAGRGAALVSLEALGLALARVALVGFARVEGAAGDFSSAEDKVAAVLRHAAAFLDPPSPLAAPARGAHAPEPGEPRLSVATVCLAGRSQVEAPRPPTT